MVSVYPVAGEIESVVQDYLGSVFPGAVIAVVRRGVVVYRRAFGTLGFNTIFDLASLTKPLATTLVTFRLVEKGILALDDTVGRFLPEAAAEDRTIRELMTHTAGMPAIPELQRFFPNPADRKREEARRRLLEIAPAAPAGESVVYSCTGFLVLGEVLAQAYGAPLDTAFRDLVGTPLGLRDTGFAPRPKARSRCAPTERCPWRGRVIVGEVHDESSWCLEGVAGNAGLFSTLDEVIRLAGVFTPDAQVPLLMPATIAAATRSYTDGRGQRRGIGLQINDDEAAGGRGLSRDSFGHTGFTGTCFWIDPERDLLVVSLTNRVYYGRDLTAATIKQFRRELHAAVAECISRHE